MKICKKCNQEKDINSFRISNKNKDNRSGTCKTCQYSHEPYKKPEIEKSCTKCLITKSLEDFPFNNKEKNWRGSWCRNCCYKRMDHKELIEGSKRRIYKKDQKFKNDLRVKYNLTFDQYLKLIEDQQRKCKICNLEEVKLNIDHDHKTGRIRGLLCRNCNLGLGFMKDNCDILAKSIEYLTETNI